MDIDDDANSALPSPEAKPTLPAPKKALPNKNDLLLSKKSTSSDQVLVADSKKTSGK